MDSFAVIHDHPELTPVLVTRSAEIFRGHGLCGKADARRKDRVTPGQGLIWLEDRYVDYGWHLLSVSAIALTKGRGEASSAGMVRWASYA